MKRKIFRDRAFGDILYVLSISSLREFIFQTPTEIKILVNINADKKERKNISK